MQKFKFFAARACSTKIAAGAKIAAPQGSGKTGHLGGLQNSTTVNSRSADRTAFAAESPMTADYGKGAIPIKAAVNIHYGMH
ncbi:hypothetical protein [Roseovarius aestuarii]|uniref:hypothetical protein n=1 Tax=Roseovarius aestuarii TaxID=475083 RepID=UPI00111BDC2A|nr:hypothetical protein [Roseovarius aestuarii]